MGGFLKVTPKMCPSTRTGRTETEPMLSIPKSGAMALNKAAVAAFKLENCDQIQLYWDADKRRIGLKAGGFTSIESRDAFHLYRPKGSAAQRINASGFLVYAGIDRSESRRYLLAKDDVTGLLVAELNSPLPGRQAKK